jgi:polar amino acid transport system substrate-binding protein
MKTLKKFLFTILACSSIFAADDATFTVGTNAEFPPFSFIKDGKILGFDIDVAQEVCKRLNKKMQIKDLPFDALIPELTLGQVQFVAAGISYTEDRAKRVFFVKPHLTNDSLIVLGLKKEGTDQKDVVLADVVGKKVIVNDGYTADLYLSNKPGMNLIRLGTTTDAFMALKSGRADYFVTAKSTFKAYTLQQPVDMFKCNVLVDIPENYSLIVSKKYPAVYEDIQKTIQNMIDDGTLSTIRKKWQLDD